MPKRRKTPGGELGVQGGGEKDDKVVERAARKGVILLKGGKS